MSRTEVIQEGVLQGAVASLEPFVERLLDLRVPYGQLEKRLRELCVRVAEKRGAGPDGTVTDSGIAVLTGINRKEVRRIRSERRAHGEPRTFARSVATNLLRVWATDPESSDRRGRPRPLPFRSKTGPSFVALARRVTGELRPKAILEELLRTGAVERREDGSICPVSQSFLPKQITAERLALLSEDPAELAGTMLANMLDGETELRFQRRVFFDDVGEEALPRARRDARREGERMVRKMTRVLGRYDRDVDANAPGGDQRYVSFGLYYFESSDPRKTRGARRGRPSRSGRRKR